jgi:proteasome lid subunit RPN8/RPN11
MLTPTILEDIRAHADVDAPRECCGLLVALADGIVYWPCRNRWPGPNQFDLHPEDWANAEDHGEIIAVVHSHINQSAEPSVADRIGCEASGLPWFVIAHPSGDVRRIEPCGYQVPLIGREFVYGVFDCFTLIRDYYREHLGILISDFGGYDWEFWKKGQDLYGERFAAAGFMRIDEPELQEHDVLLLQVAGSPVANHAAIYLGGNMILHHLQDRLSMRAPYGGIWQKYTRFFLRHEKLC